MDLDLKAKLLATSSSSVNCLGLKDRMQTKVLVVHLICMPISETGLYQTIATSMKMKFREHVYVTSYKSSLFNRNMA